MNAIWGNYFWQLFHLTVSLFAAAAFACTAWLHADAWQYRKNKSTLLRALGFFIIALAFLLAASQLESQLFFSKKSTWRTFFISSLEFLGYICLVISLLVDPLQPKPGEKKPKWVIAFVGQSSPLSTLITGLFLPVSAFATAFLFRKKATVGLEKHVAPLFSVFLIFGLFHLLGSALTFSHVTIWEDDILAPFGPVWLLQKIMLTIGSFLLFRWCFSYLLKQFTTQLMVLFSGAILLLFLSVSTSYTTLLITQLNKTTTLQMAQAARLVKTILDHKIQETVLLSETLAADTRLSQVTQKSEYINQLVIQYSREKKRSIWLTDKRGIVIAASDRLAKPDIGNINKAISLSKAASIVVIDTLFGKQLSLQSAVPIVQNGQLTGVAASELVLDTPFLDELKNQAGYDLTLYSQDEIAATTITAADETTRPVGQTETKKKILIDVLAGGQTAQTLTTIAGGDYIAAYTPLTNASGTTVGMLSVATPAYTIYQAVGKTIEQTLLLATFLMLLSLIPSWLLAGYIAKQVR